MPINLDKVLGVAVNEAECTCFMPVAGDHIDFSGCACHAVASLVIQECCYCDGPQQLDANGNCPCFKGYTEKHATTAAALETKTTELTRRSGYTTNK